MATTVVSLPLPQPGKIALAMDNPAEARKRRREILTSQRSLAASPDVATSAGSEIAEYGHKKRRVSDCAINNCDPPVLVSPSTPPKLALSAKGPAKPKKPQMKYDPDVPMTKEEAAVWRREQRRKRNRESAAASRQRQRDRIVELEGEVEEWKAKFDEAMKRIRQLEAGASSCSTNSCYQNEGQCNVAVPNDASPHEDPAPSESLIIHSPEALVEEVFKDTTFLVSPSHSPRSVSPPVHDATQAQANIVGSNDVEMSKIVQVELRGEETEPSKMISRPAVKISGSSSLPLLPDESMLSPDDCQSLPVSAIKLEPIDSTLFPRPKGANAGNTPTVEEDEAEFGEFLLDAVDWL